MSQATKAASVLGDVRIPHAIIGTLLAETIQEIADDRIADRMVGDKSFQIGASSMTHDILISTTLAQTLVPEAPFAQMLSNVSFSGNDKDLMRIGQAMTNKIRALPRVSDANIPDEVLKSRFDVVLAAI